MADGVQPAPGWDRAWPSRAPLAPADARSPIGRVDARPVGAESAESPHCIALQVATVRYIVEEKPAVTCDDAKTPWSGEG